ncbi:Hermansky-Pudlak syndrome 1 protein isoform X2 [Erpetoichthys calabaricus]|uniref:Hermansky-Pudlak syndrome 1 protein isoform X2 n=1 Tax=Erpetoichthys calabaricus TaxID=27687 RepID=UPI002234A6F7|nr:Hermansky-Pudlak syndrome 1 protein isoform X2 [Erpetoichthys calabaricus]
MKCLLVVTESAEILFYWTDAAFEKNLREQYGAVENTGDRLPAVEDSINTLFAPLIISCSTLIEKINDIYTSFVTENGHHYILHQFGECLYIAVNGDGSESEDDLRRKIFVLKKFMEVQFGMVTLNSTLLKKELRPNDTGKRGRLWKMLQGLLDTYDLLRNQEQSFMVEAVERLIHPTLCEQCIEFLERRVVQQINGSPERAGEEVLHAFILVHTKLLAFYSSRSASSVKPSDLLALILLVQNMYPDISDHGDAAAEPPSLHTYSSGIVIQEKGRRDLLATNISTPSNTSQEDFDVGSAPEVYYTPQPSPTGKKTELMGAEEECTPVFQFVEPDIQMAEDSLNILESEHRDPAFPRRVFLEATFKDGYCPMMPHSMYCLPLWPGISLVLLTKIPNSQVAVSLYNFLEAFSLLEKKLNEVQEGIPHSRLQSSLPSLADLRTKLDKFIRALGNIDQQLQNTWTDFKNKAFLRTGQGNAQELLPLCRSLRSQLCAIYRQYFVTEGQGSHQRLSENLQKKAFTMMQEKLTDWKDFLLVKSKRNITMVSYLEEFPGLIHFIYVDRTAGQMISPSLSVSDDSTSELGKGPLAHFIKSKVWSLVRTSRRYLQKGYTTVTLRDGDYYFSYFLWFENETGYKLEVIELPVLSDDSAPIGMLAGDYYRQLLRYYSKTHQTEIIKCYELMTIHLGVIPPDSILQQCCDLARKLWEPSRIPLL